MPGYSFGMRSVLLIISVPESANSSASGCSFHGPERPGAAAQIVAERVPATRRRPARPSGPRWSGSACPRSSFTLSPPAGERLGGDVVAREAAHAAADEVDEHDRSPSRRAGPRRKPSAAGATPNEITSASESSSRPSAECCLPPARDAAVEHVEDERAPARAPPPHRKSRSVAARRRSASRRRRRRRRRPRWRA